MGNVAKNRAAQATISDDVARCRKLFWRAFDIECPDRPAALFSSWHSSRTTSGLDTSDVEIGPGRLPEWLQAAKLHAEAFARKHHLLDFWAVADITNTLTMMINAGMPMPFGEYPLEVKIAPTNADDDAALNHALAVLLEVNGIPNGVGIPLPILNQALEIQAQSRANRIKRMRTVSYSGHWNPFEEPRMNASKRIRAEFEKQLAAELDRIEAETDQSRKPVNFDDLTPFRWLVRSQVLRETFDDIAEREARTWSAVQKGANKAARACGLTTDTAGRPRGAKEKRYRSVKVRLQN